MGDTTLDQDHRRATVESAGVKNFSELLLSTDGVLGSSGNHREDNGGEGGEDSLGFVFSGIDRSRMLCFSGGYRNDDVSLFLEPSNHAGVSVPDLSCINSSTNSNDVCTVDTSTKSSNKRMGLSNSLNPDHDIKPGKKGKRNQDKSSVKVAKVRKEKLGERIAALQQLVSPYGKTDAASVLHEAMGYIKFLQDQIQVLCSPYLVNYSLEGGAFTGDIEPGKKVRDLRSRGLCLVPVSSTVHVDNSNGADFWSPATMCHTTSMHQMKDNIN